MFRKNSRAHRTVIVPALVILAVEVWTESCTCVVKHGGHVALIQELNLRIYTISWCQEWDLFEHSSYYCIWNSSSENNRTFHITSSNISSFNIRSARLDLPPFSSFKSIQVNSSQFKSIQRCPFTSLRQIFFNIRSARLDLPPFSSFKSIQVNSSQFKSIQRCTSP